MRRQVSITHDEGDGGAGVRRMARHLAHRVDGERDAEERLAEARRFVAEIKGWYLDVFDAIVRNGNDREKSIREIGERCASRDAAKKRYFRARSKLVKLMYLFERISPR